MSLQHAHVCISTSEVLHANALVPIQEEEGLPRNGLLKVWEDWKDTVTLHESKLIEHPTPRLRCA
jgi:hypothetical protein